jgi:hypothetical protein
MDPSQFPAEPLYITGLALRAAPGTGALDFGALGNIYMSTSPNWPNSSGHPLLSLTFSDNIGPDNTLVRSSNLNAITTTGPGCTAPGPCPFATYIPTGPFFYNPANGPLLIDFQFTSWDGHGQADSAICDVTNCLSSGIYENPAGPPTASKRIEPLIMRLKMTPANSPVLSGPAATGSPIFASFSCIENPVCVDAWGELQSGNSLGLVTPWQGLGLPGPGYGLSLQPQPSAIEGDAGYVFGSGICTSNLVIPGVLSPPSFQGLGVPGCGEIDAYVSGEGGLGTLKAAAYFRASFNPSTPNFNVGLAHGDAFFSEMLYFQQPPFVYPPSFPPLLPSSLTSGVAEFTFTIDGTLGPEPGSPSSATAGYFLADAGGPCLTQMGLCGPWKFKWVQGTGSNPSQTFSQTVTAKPIQFIQGEPMTASFVLDAFAGSGGPNAYVVADLTSTAKLTGIRLFQGTLDNVGPEITNFTILSASGKAYNQHGAVMDVQIAFADDDRVPEINLESKVTVVAVLSSPTFNAPAMVVPSSLTFGASGTENSLGSCQVGDLNHDGLPDLVCQFYTAKGSFSPGQTIAVLQGQTTDGRAFQGMHAIVVDD